MHLPSELLPLLRCGAVLRQQSCCCCAVAGRPRLLLSSSNGASQQLQLHQQQQWTQRQIDGVQQPAWHQRQEQPAWRNRKQEQLHGGERKAGEKKQQQEKEAASPQQQQDGTMRQRQRASQQLCRQNISQRENEEVAEADQKEKVEDEGQEQQQQENRTHKRRVQVLPSTRGEADFTYSFSPFFSETAAFLNCFVFRSFSSLSSACFSLPHCPTFVPKPATLLLSSSHFSSSHFSSSLSNLGLLQSPPTSSSPPSPAASPCPLPRETALCAPVALVSRVVLSAAAGSAAAGSAAAGSAAAGSAAAVQHRRITRYCSNGSRNNKSDNGDRSNSSRCCSRHGNSSKSSNTSRCSSTTRSYRSSCGCRDLLLQEWPPEQLLRQLPLCLLRAFHPPSPPPGAPEQHQQRRFIPHQFRQRTSAQQQQQFMFSWQCRPTLLLPKHPQEEDRVQLQQHTQQRQAEQWQWRASRPQQLCTLPSSQQQEVQQQQQSWSGSVAAEGLTDGFLPGGGGTRMQVRWKKKRGKKERLTPTPEQEATKSKIPPIRLEDRLVAEPPATMARTIRREVARAAAGWKTKRMFNYRNRYRLRRLVGLTHDIDDEENERTRTLGPGSNSSGRTSRRVVGRSFVTPLTRLQHQATLPRTPLHVRFNFPHTLSYDVWWGPPQVEEEPHHSACWVSFRVADLKLSERQEKRLLDILGEERIDEATGIACIEADLFPQRNQNAAYLGDILQQLMREVRKV